MRKVLPQDQVTDTAMKSIASFHGEVVEQVREAVRANKIVVIGMTGNPFVKKARTLLEEKGKEFKYLGFGSYFVMWKERLAIKLWSGWPTFPQVFINGRLIGGYTDLVEYLKNEKN